MLRILSGTTCPGLSRAPSVSGFFANANSFSGGSARSALRGTLPVKCRRRMDTGSSSQFVLTNSKEDEHMEKKLSTAAGASVPGNQEQNLSTETKCPFSGGARKHAMAGAPTNADWWPNQLNLKILHQHSPLSDPIGKAFNYAEEFKSLDLDAVIGGLPA